MPKIIVLVLGERCRAGDAARRALATPLLPDLRIALREFFAAP